MKNKDIYIGFVVPLSGSAGVFGPSSCNCINLAADMINQQGGLLGRQIKIFFIDGGQGPAQVSENVQSFLKFDVLDFLIGFHDSSVRRAIIENCSLKIPYIYVPPYEGGENAEGVFMLGETSAQQLRDTVPTFIEKHSARKWYLIGNDYRWPRNVNATAREYILENGAEIVGEHYVPFGFEDYEKHLDEIRKLQPDMVFFTLVGSDAIDFNRQFACEADLLSIKRFGPLLEENALFGMGLDASDGIYSVSSYYTCLDSSENHDLKHRYEQKYGQDAVQLTSLSESCFEALIFLKKLCETYQSIELPDLMQSSPKIQYQGPRGTVSMNDRHLIQDIHLAQVRDFDFHILETFSQVKP